MKETSQEIYKNMELLIYNVVHKFQRKYGGDFKELHSEANEIFMLAYNTYNPKKAQFSTWLVFLLQFKLIDNLRERIKDSRHIKYGCEYGGLQKHIQDETMNDYFLLRLQDRVQEEYRDIISLILDMPRDLEKMVLKRGGKPRNLRSSLRTYLKNHGWTKKQICAGFDNIKQALHT